MVDQGSGVIGRPPVSRSCPDGSLSEGPKIFQHLKAVSQLWGEEKVQHYRSEGREKDTAINSTQRLIRCGTGRKQS